MTISLPPGLSKLLAVLLLAAVIAGGYLLLVQPLAARFGGQRDAIASSRQLLARYRALGRDGGALTAEARQLQTVRTLETAYLTGDSDALTAAKLQALVEQAVARHGGQLQTTQPLPAAAEEGFKRIAVRVQLTAGIEPLRRILYGLEAGQPYLFLDNLEIRRGRGSAARLARATAGGALPGPGTDGSAAPPEEPLSIRLDIFGYAQSLGTKTEATGKDTTAQ